MFAVKILADSVCPRGVRLTTMEWTFPRCILAEVNTHRMMSRNAASSRAIPWKVMVQRVMDDPFIPVFRRNKKGMQAGEPLHGFKKFLAVWLWLEKRNAAVRAARLFGWLGVHKQYVNRLLEPWMYCTVIISATDWENLFALRCHEAAEPSFQKIADMAYAEYQKSVPKRLVYGEWHLPLTFDEDLNYFGTSEFGEIMLCKVSVGRCARVSYLTHDGRRDVKADYELADRLAESGHWSPFEHCATPALWDDMVYKRSQLRVEVRSDRAVIEPKDGEVGYCGNFKGWKQYRKMFHNENIVERPEWLKDRMK